jgi:hypothetical protein
MKVSQLKTLIKEAVKEAIQEELGSMQQPAPVQEVKVTTLPPPPAPIKTGNSLLDALNETKHTFTTDEYRTMVNANSSMVSAPGLGMQSPAGPQPGLDISQLDFTKNAGAIFKKSNELDKVKHGL